MVKRGVHARAGDLRHCALPGGLLKLLVQLQAGRRREGGGGRPQQPGGARRRAAGRPARRSASRAPAHACIAGCTTSVSRLELPHSYAAGHLVDLVVSKGHAQLHQRARYFNAEGCTQQGFKARCSMQQAAR